MEARRLLDGAPSGDYANTKIMVSGDLNEYQIHDLLNKATMVLMDDMSHVIIVLSDLPMKSHGVDFEKYLKCNKGNK